MYYNQYRRVCYSYLFLLIFGLSISLIITGNSSAAIIKVTVHLPPHREADVAPGKSGTAIFNGEIKAIGIGLSKLHQVLVELEAEPDTKDWAASVSPPFVILMPPRWQAPITVSVCAPPFEHRTDSTHPPHYVNITGTWRAIPGFDTGAIEPTKVMVTVKPFYRISIRSPNVFQEGWPGTKLVFRVIIVNQGNGMDTYKLSIINSELLTKAGWGILVIPRDREIEIEAGAEGSFKLEVYPPETFALWKSQVTQIPFQIVSEGSEETPGVPVYIRRYAVFYYERGFYFPPEPTAVFILIIIIVVGIVVGLKRRKRRRLLLQLQQQRQRR